MIFGGMAGSGCIAALEAEKFLAEQDDTDVPDGIEGESQAEKPLQNGGDAPEYKGNPLLSEETTSSRGSKV